MYTHIDTNAARKPRLRLAGGRMPAGRALAAVLAVIATLLVTVGTAAPATADIGPNDDRLMTAPAAWWRMYEDVDASSSNTATDLCRGALRSGGGGETLRR
jgi:hypothetical protein